VLFGSTSPTAPTHRSAVFVGNALSVEVAEDSSNRRIVRFITELSWRGPMRDTVTLVLADAPCAYFLAGARYLVAAEPDAAEPARLRTLACDNALQLGTERVTALLDTLGPPNWRAPPIGERDIAAAAVPLGAVLQRSAHPSSAFFGMSLAFVDSVHTFEIGNAQASASRQGGPVYLSLGKLYRYRVTWKSGGTYESVLRAHCSPLSEGTDPCSLGFSMRFLMPAP
jgi:hypothetical protein